MYILGQKLRVKKNAIQHYPKDWHRFEFKGMCTCGCGAVRSTMGIFYEPLHIEIDNSKRIEVSNKPLEE